jgi:hypothetical protein
LGTVIVTRWPGSSTQPVTASGWAGFCAAATQIVCRILLTNVTKRAPAARDDEAVARAGAGIGRGRALARASAAPLAPLAVGGWAAGPPPGDEQAVISATAGTPTASAASRHDRFLDIMQIILTVPCCSGCPAADAG